MEAFKEEPERTLRSSAVMVPYSPVVSVVGVSLEVLDCASINSAFTQPLRLEKLISSQLFCLDVMVTFVPFANLPIIGLDSEASFRTFMVSAVTVPIFFVLLDVLVELLLVWISKNSRI